MRRIEYTPSFFIYLSAALLFLPLPWLVSLIIAGVLHEFGHIIVLLLMKIPIFSVLLCAGGTKILTGEMSMKQELIAAAFGPLTGLLLCSLFPWFPKLALCAFVQTLFNLLPIGNFDGARIIRCLKHHKA